MKGFKKVLSVTLCASMLFGSLTAFAADTPKDIDYQITNPYKDVNWQTVNQYKTALHTHTNASDGDISLRTSIETHVLQGFDLVATTDHGINNKSWASADQSDYKLVYGALKLFGRTEGDLDYLGSEGTFEKSGYAYTLGTENGDDYLKVKTDAGEERTIMRIPYGIENNAVSINAHVNSWFVDYQDDTVTDYIDAMRGVTKAGGICFINHPGEYTKAKEDLTSEEAYNESNWAYRYYINRFYGMIKKYPACLGIDINSKGDSRTRYDRELWDILLTRATPCGRNIFAICSSDAHQASVINTGYTRLLMENMNSKEARKALEAGAYFGCSYCNGNQKELENILEYLTEYYGSESELFGKVDAAVTAMQKRVADVASGEADVDEGPASPMKLIDNDGYFHGEDTFITGIAVDEAEDTITVNTENALLVRWIADGEVIAVTKAAEGTSTIDLDDYSDQIGCYVRAEAFGEGGTVYTNAFVLSYDGKPAEKNYPYFSFPVIDALFAEIRNLITILGRVFHNLFN